MNRFVAFLRGINVGGHKKVPMKDLKEVFEKHGFTNVKTLLASGNVIFEGNKNSTEKIRGILEESFGFTIPTIVIPYTKIDKIVKSDPFSTIQVTPKTRLYITFLKNPQNSRMKIPYTSEDGSFNIIKLDDKIIYSVLDLEKSGTIDAMNILEKEFGKVITTRNYNTIVKIAQL